MKPRPIFQIMYIVTVNLKFILLAADVYVDESKNALGPYRCQHNDDCSFNRICSHSGWCTDGHTPAQQKEAGPSKHITLASVTPPNFLSPSPSCLTQQSQDATSAKYIPSIFPSFEPSKANTLTPTIEQTIYAVFDTAKYFEKQSNLTLIANLSKWYDPVAVCMLSTSKQNLTYQDAFMKCKEETSTPNATHPFGILSTDDHPEAQDIRHTWCCTSEVPLRQRGYLEALGGHTDPDKHDAELFMESLKASNRSLVLLGDSTSTQMFFALKEELYRETKMPAKMVTKDTRIKIQSLHPSLNFNPFFNVFSWRGVLVYALQFLRFQPETIEYDKATILGIVPALLDIHTDGLVFVANIGHHLGTQTGLTRRGKHHLLKE